jgi:hypothetical protein
MTFLGGVAFSFGLVMVSFAIVIIQLGRHR